MKRQTPLIKLCGINTPDAMAASLRAGADLVGLVHFAKSPRHVSLHDAARLAALARKDKAAAPGIVVLLVDPDDDALRAVVATIAPDYIQLHGAETPARVTAIRALTHLPVIKALGVGEPSDLDRARDYLEAADHLLLDARPAPGADLPGGNGTVFDWSLVSALDPAFDFILSGGLTPETVGGAIAQVRPAGVDVSSGIERAPGVKDAARIEAFVRQARRAFEHGPD
jgi:phosphoribosylanthranilate isomerase